MDDRPSRADGMTEENVPSDEIPIPAILLAPKNGSAVERVRVRNTNWKGVVGIVVAVVVAPNFAALASSAPAGAPFAVALAIALATPLVAILAGIRMAFDIRRGAESSKGLAVAAIVTGMGMSALMIIALVLFSAFAH
ncbi:MAG TPA: hypothetical protein VF362_00560 [Demequinaceae bacterium]